MPKISYTSDSDYQKRNQALLQNIIEDETKRQQPGPLATVSVAQARAGEALVERVTDRETTRILFISRDASLLNPTQQTLDGYLNLSDVFDEVHIVVLRTGIAAKTPVMRVADNVWVYVATADYWWQTPWAAEEVIADQLEFASGFRPDLIVARDPFECGWVAMRLGKKFARPTQVHIVDDIIDPLWVASDPVNKWRLRALRFIMPRFASVRTSSEQLRTYITERFPTIEDVATLPRFNNYQSLKQAEPAFDIKDKYQQFSFIILYVGRLNRDSTLHVAIDAARFILRNARIGLVVIGDGVARDSFIERTRLLGIQEQVVFERSVEDMVSYYKTADVMLVTDTNEAADEVVLSAAAAGLPLIVTPTALRTDLFAHRESALIARDGAVVSITDEIGVFINDVAMRSQLKHSASQAVTSRLYQDPQAYLAKYRYSVESALLHGQYAIAEAEDATTEAAAVAPEQADHTRDNTH